MAALQHHPAVTTRTAAQLPCRAQQQSQPPAAHPQQPAIASRRRALAAAVLLPAAAAAVVAAPRPAAAADVAAEAAAAADAVAEGAAPAAALDVVSWPQWIDRTFSFSYPPGFKEQDPSFAAPQKTRPNAGKHACFMYGMHSHVRGPEPGHGTACKPPAVRWRCQATLLPLSRLTPATPLPSRPPCFLPPAEQVAENLLKAAVRSGDGQQRIDVVVRQATALKRTLFQVTGAAGGPVAILWAVLWAYCWCTPVCTLLLVHPCGLCCGGSTCGVAAVRRRRRQCGGRLHCLEPGAAARP